uniref:Synaptobrevin n=1 Tax=Cacopsylla melanoneura TaxID=428564 RepID=A0A8D8UCQ6_9HEMI
MDSEFAGNSSGRQQRPDPKSKLQESQKQVDEVVGIMRVNVEKVLERDQKLSELDNRANALQQGASQFEQQAGKLKKKMWWKNMKWMIIMGSPAAIVLILIIWWIAGDGDSKPNN